MRIRAIATGVCLLVIHTQAQRLPVADNVTLYAYLDKIKDIVDHKYVLIYNRDSMLHTLISYVPRNDSLQAMTRDITRTLPFDVIYTNLPDNFVAVNFHRVIRNLVVTVSDESGLPLRNILVTVRNTGDSGRTDVKGMVTLHPAPDTASVIISGEKIEDQLISLNSRCLLEVQVHWKVKILNAVTVLHRASNGFHFLAASNSPPSFALAETETLNRVVATNIINHFAFSGSALLPGPSSGNGLGLTIRGRNTINSSNMPLLVWDNFAYPGYPGDVNPYDISTVTVLKDAAASSIWGALSSNGVIVLTSNEGHYNQASQWIFTMNTTYSEKPRLSYLPWMNASEFIGAEWLLFQNHAYDANLNNTNFPITPAVRLFGEWRDQGLARSAMDQQQHLLEQQSSIADLNKYFYQSRINQQYHMSFSGGTLTQKYYASAGYDYDPTALARNSWQRYTLRGSYSAHPRPHLKTCFTLNFASIRQNANNDGTLGATYPYAQAVDDQGNPAIVSHKYNPTFLDTAGHGLLQDWRFRPLRELQLADNHTSRSVLNIQTNIDWRLAPGVSAAVIYRLFKSWSSNDIIHSKNSYYVHDLVNQYSELNGTNTIYPIPPGNILFSSDTAVTGHNLRAQLGFSNRSPSKHQWKALIGTELTANDMTGGTGTVYGYDGHGSPPQMDLVHLYPTLTEGKAKIPNSTEILGSSSRYLSGFSNINYTCGRQYALYGSFRLDGSNLIGVDSRRKWAVSWSLGASRVLDSSLKLRASYGCDGNLSKRIAYLTIQGLGYNNYGLPQSGIDNSPDPGLGWEKTWMENLGVDFSLFRDKKNPQGRLNGSVDLYFKQAGDLIANDSLPLSSGYSFFVGNAGGIHGYGFDLVINSENLRGSIGWQSTMLLSFSKDWISRYPFLPKSPQSYVAENYPRIGKSPSGIYSYRWSGLDHGTGDPMGYLNGQASKDYLKIMQQPEGGYVYNGSYQPTLFGSLLNTFTWKAWSLSAMISYKGGYWFRRSSINYDELFNERSAGHKDFDLRWQNTGDEKRTNVPSLPVKDDPIRDAFYLNSEALVTRGDHIRLQDIQLSYTLTTKSGVKLPIRQAIFYLYVNNPGIIWKANHYGIDPDAPNYGDLPAPRSWSFGGRFSF